LWGFEQVSDDPAGLLVCNGYAPRPLGNTTAR